MTTKDFDDSKTLRFGVAVLEMLEVEPFHLGSERYLPTLSLPLVFFIWHSLFRHSLFRCFSGLV
jgi:hypothetical protein